MGALVLGLCLAAYGVDGVIPSLPTAADDLGVSVPSIQLTTSAFLLGAAVGQPAFGAWSDRVGRRVPLICGLALFVAASVLAVVAPDLSVLIVARLTQGLATAAPIALGKAIVRDASHGREAIASLATMSAAAGALNIAAPVLGGLLAAAGGWRLSFVLLIALGGLALAATAVFVREPRKHRDEPVVPKASRIRDVLGNPTFLGHVVACACGYGAIIAFVAASPFVYQDLLGFGPTPYGLLFGMNGVIMVVLNLVVNRILRPSSVRRVAVGAAAVSVVSAGGVCLAWSLSAPVPVIVALLATTVAPLPIIGPNLIGLALDRAQGRAGTASAIIGFAQFSAGAAAAPIAGLLVAASPIPVMCLIVGMMIVALVVMVGDGPRGRSR